MPDRSPPPHPLGTRRHQDESLTEPAWHPEAPDSLQAELSVLVERNVESVVGALDGVDPSSPAFALCLETGDLPEEIYPIAVSLGVENDRKRLVESASPWEAWVEVWHSSNYTYLELETADPIDDPEFAQAGREVMFWLAEVGVLDFARWVLEEVAARLTREPPLQPVTDDFVAYPSHQGEEITRSLRWIAPTEIQEKLEAKRLLVDNPDQLQGAPELST